MKHIFIINPAAGNGVSLEYAKKIERICEKENIEYIIHYTYGPKEATAITKLYKKNEYIIHSVGGDGTLSEVVNGIVGTKNKLSVIPAGTGNDFFRMIKDFPEEKKIDVGKINRSYFINFVSFGLDAEIGNNAHIFKHKPLIPKGQIYNASIVYTLLNYKFREIEFILNGTKMKEEYTIVSICNGGYYGNGYKISPNSALDDGLFDIYFVEKLSKASIISFVPKIKQGTHEKDPRVQKKMASKIKVKTDYPIVCNADGEIMVNKRFDIKIIPEGITIYNNKELTSKIIT